MISIQLNFIHELSLLGSRFSVLGRLIMRLLCILKCFEAHLIHINVMVGVPVFSGHWKIMVDMVGVLLYGEILSIVKHK